MVLMKLDLSLCICGLTSIFMSFACTCELSIVLMKLDLYQCTFDLTSMILVVCRWYSGSLMCNWCLDCTYGATVPVSLYPVWTCT